MTKEERKEYYRKYYRDHKEKILEYQKRYNETHREKINERTRRYQSKHRQPQRDRMNNYHETKEGRATNLLNSYRQFDARRGWDTVLTRDDIVRICFSEDSKCVYCGINDWHVLGLDRIDNSKPHDPINTVCCCKSCNQSRHRRTLEGFFKKIGTTWEEFMKKNGAVYGDDYLVIVRTQNNH